MNPLKTLTRLFGRSQSPVVSQLYANAIGQPLLIHPQMGEALITGYMSGAIDARPPTMELLPTDAAREPEASGSSIAVVNVSGALVNRPMPGDCGPGPMSYVEIQQAFDAAMADDSVQAIVFRFESPGGSASGCFDLAEHIRASRGRKPIYASLDDYAYSAAFALAVTADEIWTTRSAGAGSVGVVGYHIDESGRLAQQGIKVTPIYSGAHKVDFNSTQPLKDAVRERMQAKMDAMRLEFATLVAESRGLDVDAVMATEAEVYSGADAVAVGFADRVGTFAQLLQHIAAGAPAPAVETPPAPEQAETDDEPEMRPAAEVLTLAVKTADGRAAIDQALAELQAELAAQTDPLASLVAAVAASKLPPALGLALISKPPEGMAADSAVSYAAKVRDLCAAAGVESLASDLVAAGTSVEAARAQLLDLRADTGPEITTHIPNSSTPSAAKEPRSTDVYRRRAAAASSGQ
ncbi:TPA_asm: capsid assembly protease C [Cyanophage Cy-LDV1]|nr:TPA_asm: capsid assembly protease C [Cyanophage Cy-LDV1]